MNYNEFMNVYHFSPLEVPVKRDTVTAEHLKNDGARAAKERYTGKIEVVLTAKTPLFIPDMRDVTSERVNGKEHKTYDFFSYDGKQPAIPGSSLRGMLRSVYETVTNSCLSVVDAGDMPVRRTSDYYTPGLLARERDGSLALYKAEKAVVKYQRREDGRKGPYNDVIRKNWKAYKEGTKVKFTFTEEASGNSRYDSGRTGFSNKGNFNGPQRAGRKIVDGIALVSECQNTRWTEGWYFKGEPGVNKKRDSANTYVFCFPVNREGKRKKGAPVWASGAEGRKSPEIQELLRVLKSYKDLSQKDNPGRKSYAYKEYAEQLNAFLERGIGCFPVHYSEVAGRLYMSPACITKEAYYTTVEEILKDQGGHQTCTDFKHLCPACRLFGMTGSGKGSGKENESKAAVDSDYPNAWAGSVRIQDALPSGVCEKMDAVTLAELSSPKRSCTEFYLKKPELENGGEILSWTYDYYVVRMKNGKGTARSAVPKLSGRKYYWHHRPGMSGEFIGKTDRNSTVRPLKEGAEFTFPVYFEKITKTQLDQLVWLCNTGCLARDENGGVNMVPRDSHAKKAPEYGYKLGKGKPLGLGSVALTVADVQIRRLTKDGKIDYHFEDYRDYFKEDYGMLTYESCHFDPYIKDAFLRLCRFDAAGNVPVIYPAAVDKREKRDKVTKKVTDVQRTRPSIRLNVNGYRWFGKNHFDAKNGGNMKLTNRENLAFQQSLVPLTKDSRTTLSVNEVCRGKYTEAYDKKEVYVTDDDVSVGAQAKARVTGSGFRDDSINAEIARKNPKLRTLRVSVKKAEGHEYRTGDEIFVEITKIKQGRNGNLLYDGKDITVYG